MFDVFSQDCVEKGMGAAPTNTNARVIRVVKIARILRIARILKLVKFVTYDPRSRSPFL